MRDVGKWLRDADPAAEEPGLSSVDAQVMRRAVIAATAEPRATSLFWPGPMLVATTIAVTLTAGVVIGRRLPPPRGVSSVRGLVSGASTGAAPQVSARRQLQFATPGGTRVIWVLDPEFLP